MDKRFFAEEFFDLSTFSHPTLFPAGEPVWRALSLISSYLDGCNLGVIESEIPEGAILVDRERISIAPGCTIEPGAYIKGPCILGPGTIVRHGAYLRGAVITEEKCVIGHATEVKNALFLKGAQAAHFNYVGDSLLGAKVNLGAGTKCANLRLDHKEIRVEGIPTGLRKFGLIAGDGAQFGCNSVTNPGSLFGKGAFLFPCATSSGFVPEGAKVE